MKKIFDNWPKLVFIALPVFIVMVDAAVIHSERNQTDAEKAIRLVRESRSRKENFTIQQYLYMTVYHRKSRGEPIEIEGWRADPPSDSHTTAAVEFIFTENGEKKVARWDVAVAARQITPQNEMAASLSWR